ncbi:SH3 domain-containing protein [Chitinophaga sp. G-6-1-13]|uniref:SH3 domain-containing protein n=2 Tax=Chitinophaga TaxID=79328 RepID=A0A365XXW8_9BACT|nr:MULTISPECIES: SH3 domain-containing protein [Chitinophaga]NML37884.1 SH3 domain-containing protein [Chitinophaga fulva]RBL91192.1 SH3 domain-containing protein [Chitinophaga flava]
MALQDKYKDLLDTATASGVSDLQVAEQDGVLHINGTAPSGDVKDKLWNIYGQIDPNFLSGDVVMDIQVATAVTGAKLTVVTESTNLNIRKGPGTDQPIVGKAAHGEIVTLISKMNEQWWLIRTDDGAEGYSYAQYLQPA